jgi:hypothetical protein
MTTSLISFSSLFSLIILSSDATWCDLLTVLLSNHKPPKMHWLMWRNVASSCSAFKGKWFAKIGTFWLVLAQSAEHNRESLQMKHV